MSSRPHDKLIWRGDNTGIYIVKSGYKWANTPGNPRLHNEINSTFFTKLRGLKIPSKIRILMWRTANKFMPTLHNLRTRKLVANTLCPVCQADKETVSHHFRDCTITQQILQGMGAANTICNRETRWKNWLENELNRQNTEICKIRSIVY